MESMSAREAKYLEQLREAKSGVQVRMIGREVVRDGILSDAERDEVQSALMKRMAELSVSVATPYPKGRWT